MKAKIIWKKNQNIKESTVAKWIVDTILKLDSKHLIEFRNLISDELRKRGVS